MIYFMNLVLFEVALRIGNTGICISCSQMSKKNGKKVGKELQAMTELSRFKKHFFNIGYIKCEISTKSCNEASIK